MKKNYTIRLAGMILAAALILPQGAAVYADTDTAPDTDVMLSSEEPETISVPDVVPAENAGQEEIADLFPEDEGTNSVAAEETVRDMAAGAAEGNGESAEGGEIKESEEAAESGEIKESEAAAEERKEGGEAAEGEEIKEGSEAAEEEKAGETEEAEEAEEVSPEEELLEADNETPTVTYRTHVQSIGWQDWRKNGAMAGTSGQAKRLEGIEIKVEGVDGLGISYKTHVQSYGWQKYVADGKMAGTTGQSKRLEAIQIKLTGEAAADYDVYYCVHVQSYGWLNWAKNDEVAGTAGYSKRLEGICIKIQKKGEEAPANLGNRKVAGLYGTVAYATHVQSIGWQGFRRDGALSGTTGMAKRLEALKMHLENVPLSGFIQYRSHVQGIGWQRGWWASDFVSGTEGESKRLEAVQIRLYGDIAEEFDIWYRTHVQKYGWTGWTSNGSISGSVGCAYRLEALEVKLLPKGSPAPGSTIDPYFTTKIEELSAQEKALLKARRYVDAITNDSMTKEEKLKVCFKSFRSKLEKSPWVPGYKGQGWVELYANSFFDLDYGNCISYAAAFAYMAKAIGYTNVYGVNTGHAWCEIDGLIYDPEWDPVWPSYGLTYTAPTTQAYLAPQYQKAPERSRVA